MTPENRRFFTRRRVRNVLGLVVLVAVGAVGVQLGRNLWAQHLRSLRTSALDFLPEVAQRIQNFRRVKMEGDRKVWEVAAKEAQYFEEDQQIVVRDPVVSFYLKGDQGAVSLKGNEGKIVLSGREMQRVDLTGEIELRFRDYLVKTDHATYAQDTDTVVTPSVAVTGDGLDLHGSRMTVEMATQRLRVEGAVETVLQRASAPGASGEKDAGTL
jgi:LPS export ABC transporter protein LptC